MTEGGQSLRATSRVHRWLALSETALGNASDRMDAINIFPVPDGDTGTNLYGTVRAARAALEDRSTDDVGEALSVAGRAALDQARGNSGTLLAVMLIGMSDPLTGHERMTAPSLSVALDRARASAWAALSDPQEGTMLTVLAVASRAASEYVSQHADLPEDQLMGRRELGNALDAVVEAAWQAVVNTEGQLPALAEAHVVDAGGLGLLLVLDSLRATVRGTGIDAGLLDGLHGFSAGDPHIHQGMDSPVGYELMCSISLDPLTAATLRFELNEVGESVIMSPVDAPTDGEGPVRWRLHVHVDDHESAEALVRKAGDPENLVVTPLQEPGQPG